VSSQTPQNRATGQPFKGHRWFAARYDKLTLPVEEKVLGKLRRELLGSLSGDVLEIGAGTGANFPYHATSVRLVGTEPDPHMLRRAREKTASMTTAVELHQVPAEELPFAGQSFDHVVSTLVLCTVQNPGAALAHIRRVLRPDGQFHFIEHVRAHGVLGLGQDVVRPLWGIVAAGCSPNRRTGQLIEAAGFRVERLQTGKMNALSPLIIGTARPA
jgi:ubiquinone/menaquinone biosynthesis C-methylase UbiE